MNKKYIKSLLFMLLMFFAINTVNAELVVDETGERFSIPGGQPGFRGGTGTKTLGQHIACAGVSKIGVKYVLGGHSLTGFDCTGFTHYALTQVGLYWADTKYTNTAIGTGVVRSVRAMKNANLMIDCNYIQPGDLLYLDYYKKWGLDMAPHVGLNLGGDNFIHQTTSGTGAVQVDDLTKYKSPGRMPGCARPYTYNQELAYEMKYQNFSKELQAIDGYNYAFYGSNLKRQTNYIRWNDWKCGDIVGKGGKLSFKVINSGSFITGAPTDEDDGIISLIKTDDKANLHLTPLAIDENFACNGMLGNINNKAEPAYWIQMSLNIVRIAAIAALLLLSTIDLVKALSAQDDEATKKAITTTLKRFMYTIILFFLPLLLNLLLGYMKVYGNDYNNECGEIIK